MPPLPQLAIAASIEGTSSIPVLPAEVGVQLALLATRLGSSWTGVANEAATEANARRKSRR